MQMCSMPVKVERGDGGVGDDQDALAVYVRSQQLGPIQEPLTDVDGVGSVSQLHCDCGRLLVLVLGCAWGGRRLNCCCACKDGSLHASCAGKQCKGWN